MNNFIIGVIVGIVLSTIGLKGVAHMLETAAPTVDHAVQSVKDSAKDAEKQSDKLKPLN